MKGTAVLKFLALVAIIIGIFVASIVPLATNIKQGLDLQGGTHIVLEAKESDQGEINDDTINRAIKILERRVNEMGLTEPIIQREGQRRIIIELPGENDPDAAIKTVGKTAVLEFKDQNTGQTIVTGNDLKDVKASKDQGGLPVINLEMTPEGAKIFGDYTATHIGQIFSISLDGQVLTAPVIKSSIPNGNAQISGSQSLEEANETAMLLRSGALPVKLEVMEVRTVGPSLGQDSKDKSVMAFGVGLALIVIFLLVLYRLSGFVATLAMLVFVMITLLCLQPFALNATLTLPGIAGIILSMGVAVDANILIFERFKEEVFWGAKSMRAAMENAFRRAFTTILDANTSVIITAVILIVMGSGPVRGFAITLALGVIVSMFTAITMSRFLLRALIACNFTNHPFWYGVNVSPMKTLDLFSQQKGGKK